MLPCRGSDFFQEVKLDLLKIAFLISNNLALLESKFALLVSIQSAMNALFEPGL